MTFYRLYQPSKLLALMLGVSVTVHALLWLLLRSADVSFLAPAPADTNVELVLVDEAPTPVASPQVEEDVPPPPEAPETAEPEGPRDITLTPERLATAPPEQADYLSDVDSRASDLVPGGTPGSQPGATNPSDYQSVAIQRENLGGAGQVAVEDPVFQPEASAPQPEPAPERPAGAETSPHGDMPAAELQEAPADESRRTDDEADDEATDDRISDYEDWVTEQRVPSLLGSGDRGFDFDQNEYGDVEANVDIVGGDRLNTYEWNFAPWIRRFANDLQRSWIPPYAYGLGIIDGRTEVRVVIERDGTPSRMDVLATEGHESLHKASLNALKACAPYRPLPPDFPKPQLVIVFTLIYPELRR